MHFLLGAHTLKAAGFRVPLHQWQRPRRDMPNRRPACVKEPALQASYAAFFAYVAA